MKYPAGPRFNPEEPLILRGFAEKPLETGRLRSAKNSARAENSRRNKLHPQAG
jgi:hypothetical protein